MFLCSCMLLAYVRKTNLTQKLFSTVPSQKIERSCIIYMLVVFKFVCMIWNCFDGAVFFFFHFIPGFKLWSIGYWCL